MNALSAILRPEFKQKLSKNEKDLIKISLSQLIIKNTEDESILEKVLEAFITLIDFSLFADNEFDILEQFIESNISSPRYSKSIVDNAIKGLLKLKVSEKNERDNMQLMISFSFNQIHSLYSKFSIAKGLSSNVTEFIKVAVKDFQLSSDFSLNMIKCPKKWINQIQVVELVQQLLEKSNASQEQVNTFYMNAIQAIGQSSRDNSTLVSLLITKLKKSSFSQDKLLSKLIGQCLIEKQKNQQFDMRGLLQIMFTQIMGGSQQKLVEFFIKLAIESKNEVKKVFAIISLSQIIKQKAITPQIFMISSLILLQNSSKQVRMQTLNMVEAFNTLKDEREELQVFNNTPKPQSSKKSIDKQDFTPLKVQPLQNFLKQLLQLKHEIIADYQQTITAINQSPNVNIIDNSVRFLLDLPSTKMKIKFLVALKGLNKYSIIFGMSLQEQLNKEYFTLKQKNKIIGQDNTYITVIGQLIEKMTITKSNDAHEEFISSLVFPFIQFVLSHNLSDPLVEEQVTSIFQNNLLRSEVFKKLKSEHTISILKLFVNSQLSMQSKLFRQRIRETLVQHTQLEGNFPVLTDRHVIPIILDVKDKISQAKQIEQNLINQLEVVLEILTQIRVLNEVNLMEDILDIVMVLGRRSNEGSIYLIELCVQLCIQIIQGNQKIKGNTQKTLSLVNDLISSQMQCLKVQMDAILNIKNADLNDPFQQFIMEVDTKIVNPVDNNEDEKLIKIMQVISSISNLLLQFEINVLINSEETQKHLEELSQLLKTIIADERSKSAKGRTLILSLFKFYHQQVLRATKVSNKKNVDVKLMLSSFIDNSLLDIGLNLDEIFKCIESVTSETQLTAFVCLILFSIGKDKVQVKDDMQLDSLEIQILNQLFINNKHVLQLFEELLFLVVSLKISKQSEQFIQQRLSIIFESETVSQRMAITSFVYNKYVKDEKQSRKIKFLGVYLMNEWLSKNILVQRQLSYATKESPQESNNHFYYIYLSSSVFNESLNHELQSKEQQGDEKKAKKSLKRLFSRIQDFQRNLNNLLSYEVQVSIVLSVMNEFKDTKQTINMRTSTMQLLINKTPQFAQSLSKVQEKEMIIIFSPLITLTIQNLEGMLNLFSGKANTDKQNYMMALFSLLQRTASTLLNSETKAKIVKLVLGFSQHMHQLSIMVHSQLILTAMTLFEVHHLDLLEHLQSYFEMLVSSFKRVQQHLQSQDFFVDSFSRTLLKASLSLCAFFSKFMTAIQYEAIIKHVIVITRSSFNEDVKTVLDVISKESTKNVGFKLVFQAMLNSYDEVIISAITQEETTPDVSQIILRYFNDLFSQVIQRVKKEFLVENYQKLFDFFKDAFAITHTYQKLHNHIDMANVIEVEEAIAQCYQQFVVKLNEDQLRPLIVKQTKWTFKSKGIENDAFPFNLHKAISFLRSMNALLNGLREFFVPLMPLYFEKIITIINILGQQKEQVDKKRKRQQIDFNADDKENHTFYELLTLAVKNIQLNFVFDNVSFIQNDSFEKISEPLAKLVTLTSIGSEYTNFLEDVLKSCVFDIVERINNDDMWKKINYDILMHTRDASAQVRLGAFKIVEHLFNRIGERYLILLNDTIPFLSEGMEDENPDVEACAKAIVARIEHMTGDSIHEYLK